MKSHLTLEQREEIQECLNHGMTFKAIAKRVDKNPTTISREVKAHSTISTTKVVHRDASGNVISVCCPNLLKPPFVCNACKRRRYPCEYDKRLYSAINAHKAYTELLSSSREGIPLTKEQFYENDRILTDGIRHGQRLYHIIQSNHLNIALSTVYRHTKKNYFSFAPIDLPRMVKFKLRKAKCKQIIPNQLKIGRKYSDFQEYISITLLPHVEMDTVIGRIGGKVLLTFNFPNQIFFLAFICDDKSSKSITETILYIKSKLSACGLRFGDLFPVILTDNGGEFANVFAIENDAFGNRETRLFFCDAAAPYEKPHIEKNHVELRNILPKSTNFDMLTQGDINLIVSHINSTRRKQLNGISPYEMFAFTYGKEVLDCFGIQKIPDNEVKQGTQLLSEIMKRK